MHTLTGSAHVTPQAGSARRSGGGSGSVRHSVDVAEAGVQGTVQRDTNNASAAVQRTKKKLTRIQLQALGELQKTGYSNIGRLDRVKQCGTIPVVNGRVGLGITGAGGVQVSGLARCGSRWCSECWGKVAAVRTGEITQVAEWASEQRFQLVMMTLTAGHVQKSILDSFNGDRHKALIQQNLVDLFAALSLAWRTMHSGRQGKKFAASRIGYARSFELTMDTLFAHHCSGVHGHFHVLLVLDKDVHIDAMKSLYWHAWEAACKKADLVTSNRGFDFKKLDVNNQKDIKSAASYLVKGEKRDAEKIGLELTRSDVKTSQARTSPEGFLRAAALISEETDIKTKARAYAQWRGVEEACIGRRWLTWSRDLRVLAGLGVEKSDEEIANSEHVTENEKVALVRWAEVRDHVEEIRDVIRGIRLKNRWSTLILLLDSYGIKYEEVSWDTWTNIMREHQREKWKK